MAPSAPIVLLAVLALGKGAPSPTEPIAIRVEFDAPAGCSSADAFYAGVMARSERIRRAGPGEDGLRLGVRVTRAGGKVHGELRVLDGRSDLETRRVEGLRCDEVVEVLSLTAALAIDPTAKLGPTLKPAPAPPPPPSPPATAGSNGGASAASAPASPPLAVAPAAPPLPPAPAARPPAPPPDLRRAPEPRAPDQERLPSERGAFRLAVGAQAVGARVLSPTFSFGGGLSVRVGRRRADGLLASLELAGVYLANDPWRSSDEVVVHWTALTVTICPGWGLSTPHVGLDFCAQGVGGWLSVTDRVVTNPASAGRFWGSAGALARLGIPIGEGFSLEAEATLGIPVVERRFITTTPEVTVGTTPPLVVAAGIGIARIF